MQPRFSSASTYQGVLYYKMLLNGEIFGLAVREKIFDYRRLVHTGGEQESVREKVAMIGVLHHKPLSYVALPAGVVPAFNEWLQAKHAADVAEIRARPQVYGTFPPDDPMLAAPRLVVGAHHVDRIGWMVEGCPTANHFRCHGCETWCAAENLHPVRSRTDTGTVAGRVCGSCNALQHDQRETVSAAG